MKVENVYGEIFELTDNEEKFLKAIKRLEKMHPGRLYLFGNGMMSVRINGLGAQNTIYSSTIQCDGGDGGDVF